MLITIIIVTGLVIMTIAAAGFDYLGKKRIKEEKELEKKIRILEEKINLLESGQEERQLKIERLENETKFMGSLLEDKAK
ncbi:MAG TPA: hypothetical protein VMV44_09135 [Rectinemataceae bacterium]|nr:hypothetical protein [Rectinemataceae bacterium]